MIEVVGNLWAYPADYRVITTNGSVKSNGCCVMGRGCAKEARDRYPGLDRELGFQIANCGNTVLYFEEYKLLSFPVKHKWMEKADRKLINRSADGLSKWIKYLGEDRKFVMPKPGCGNGGLQWENVRPLIAHLPDNVYVIDFK